MNKMNKISCMCICVLFTIFFTWAGSVSAFANSAEPPGLTVIVSCAPEDLKLSLQFDDGSTANAVELQRDDKAWEAYYRFFYSMASPERPSMSNATLIAQSDEKSFQCKIPSSAMNTYNNLITLNFDDESIATGASPFRKIFLVSMRIILTLLIEGLIFFAFGYRRKASWIVFFAINLVTQAALNLGINGPHLNSYWIFAFIFFEIIIFIAEALAFALVLKEHKKSRAIIYALTANFASLLLGGALITYLPA